MSTCKHCGQDNITLTNSVHKTSIEIHAMLHGRRIPTDELETIWRELCGVKDCRRCKSPHGVRGGRFRIFTHQSNSRLIDIKLIDKENR